MNADTIRTNRLIYGAILRGYDNTTFAARAALESYRAGKITLAEYEAQIDAARGLSVQRQAARDAWNSGYYLRAA